MGGRAQHDAAPGLFVPRVVHRIWLGGDEPEWSRRFANTWSRPGWEIRLWTDATAPALFPLRNQAVYDDAERIAPDHVGQLRADVLRYEILERFGGLYVDTDFELLRPIEPLLEGAQCFAAWVTPHFLNNAIMGAVAAHPFIGRLVDGLAANVARHRGERPNRLTGPHYLTRTYRTHPEGVTTLASEHFYPVDWTEPERSTEAFPGAYAVHHWANQRRERGMPCPS